MKDDQATCSSFLHRNPRHRLRAMLRSLSLPSLLFIFLTPRSLAQTSDANCLPYYSWTSNSQGKTPCEVASSLLAVCNGGTFDVAALRDGQHYEGPTLVSNANSCICNTVTYSLMTACGLCQGKSTLRWNEWSKNCPNVTFSGFPESLPSGLLVPAWAYQDIRTTSISSWQRITRMPQSPAQPRLPPQLHQMAGKL
ncbi:hypothetical protein FA13DRAFT_1019483 [Coprinellus micaceus]|uniref:Cyanovirin-N domain-containing protein n=1 Tax=Coprinellus micaceus TaxID=71717 RepID=A0A4Y7SXF1_COPMI|nr:hypothetical protein FA13DRAFT_1019483 [Coprinellus micaceus]